MLPEQLALPYALFCLFQLHYVLGTSSSTTRGSQLVRAFLLEKPHVIPLRQRT